jgi:LAO/AO transport system kinase
MWMTPILRTISTEGRGVVELAGAIAQHAAHLRLSGDWALRERARLEVELEALVQETMLDRFREEVPQDRYEEVLEKVVRRNISPWEAAKILMNGRFE